MYCVGIWLIKSCYNEVQELITLFFSPPQVHCLPLVTPPTLCLPWNYQPINYRSTGSRGAWPCCVPSTTNCHLQCRWSVVHLWWFCTSSVSGQWGMWVRRRWGTLPDNKDAHCGVPPSPESCQLDPIMYKKSVIKTWWFYIAKYSVQFFHMYIFNLLFKFFIYQYVHWSTFRLIFPQIPVFINLTVSSLFNVQG